VYYITIKTLYTCIIPEIVLPGTNPGGVYFMHVLAMYKCKRK